jgi:hypothetical protein
MSQVVVDGGEQHGMHCELLMQPPAHEASTISSSHPLVAPSRHKYGRQVALAQRPILSASYIFVSCIAMVEDCTTTTRQARCYVLSYGYRMGSRHLCS